jgi:hypothetical protein
MRLLEICHLFDNLILFNALIAPYKAVSSCTIRFVLFQSLLESMVAPLGIIRPGAPLLSACVTGVSVGTILRSGH